MKYSKYSSYKDSGVEWLGDVPVDWNLYDGKRMFDNRREQSLSNDNQLAVTQKYGVLPQKEFMEKEGQKVVLALNGTDNFRHVEANDYVISLRSFQGGIEYSKYNGCVSPAYTVLKHTKNIDYQYYIRLFKSMPYIKALQSSTDSLREGKSITYEQFGSITIPMPPLQEQQAIANYLDITTDKIDTLISKQTKLIELLKEKRQALISHAVTKGLNPHAKMKQSGVEWLGEIPEHWEVKKLKFVLKLLNKKEIISNQIVVALENIESWSGKYIQTDSNYQGEDVAFTVHDILFGKLRPYLAKVLKCNFNGIAFGDLLTYRPYGSFTSNYAFYSLISEDFIKIVDSSTYGTKMPRASSEFLNEMLLTVPPLSEQQSIADYLDDKTSKIDNLIEKSTKAIDLLKERRTALISSAVTGKIDVRGMA